MTSSDFRCAAGATPALAGHSAVTVEKASISTQPRSRKTETEYAHLIPYFVEFAALPPQHPHRAELRDQLVRGHLPIAQHIARRFAHRGEPLDDLEQVATVGLINAVDRFEPARGVAFLCYAVPTITGEVRRHFRDHGWAMRVPRSLKDLHVTLGAATVELSQRHGRAPTVTELANHLDLPREQIVAGLEAANAYQGRSLDCLLVDEDGSGSLAKLIGTADNELERVEYRETLKPLLAELPTRERTILLLRFFGHMTQTQIAEQIGISQMHVSRLLTQTLATLRAGLAEPPSAAGLA